MKTLLTIIMILGTQTSLAKSNFKNPKCDKSVLRHAYEIYKKECNGAGTLDACEIDERIKTDDGYLMIKTTCAFSGEPDYNDHTEVEFVLDPINCKVQDKDVISCETD